MVCGKSAWVRVRFEEKLQVFDDTTDVEILIENLLGAWRLLEVDVVDSGEGLPSPLFKNALVPGHASSSSCLALFTSEYN